MIFSTISMKNVSRKQGRMSQLLNFRTHFQWKKFPRKTASLPWYVGKATNNIAVFRRFWFIDFSFETSQNENAINCNVGCEVQMCMLVLVEPQWWYIITYIELRGPTRACPLTLCNACVSVSLKWLLEGERVTNMERESFSTVQFSDIRISDGSLICQVYSKVTIFVTMLIKVHIVGCVK